MIKYFQQLLFLILVATSFVAAQDSSNDAQKESQEVLESIYSKAVKFYRTNQDSSIYYFGKAQDYANEIGDTSRYVKCALNAAILYKRQGMYVQSNAKLEQCLAYNPSDKIRSSCLKLLADVKIAQSDYSNAKPLLDEALLLAQTIKDTSLEINIYNSFANYYEFTNDYESAIEYHLMGANAELIQGDSLGYAISCNNMAIVFFQMEEEDKALEYILKAEKHIATDNHYNMYQVYDLKASYYAAKSDTLKAIEFNKRALEGATIVGSDDLQIGSCQNLASMYHGVNDHSAALKYISQALAFKTISASRKIKLHLLRASIYLDDKSCIAAKSELNEIEDIYVLPEFVFKELYYYALVRISACMGDKESFNSGISQYRLTVDSSYTAVKAAEAKQLEAKYQNRIISDSLQVLKLENLNKNYKLKNQRYGLLVSVLSLLIVLGLLALLRKRYQSAKAENQQLIFEKEELEVLNAQLLDRANRAKPTREVIKKLDIKSLDKQILIDPLEIVYLSAEDNGTRFYMTGKSFWSDLKLKEIQSLLPSSMFLKVFRSTIVNVKHLEWVNHATLKMTNGDELKIGRTYKSDIQKLIGSDLKK